MHWDAGLAAGLLAVEGLYLGWSARHEVPLRVVGRPSPAGRARRRRAVDFALGLLAIWVAQGTPLDDLADRYLLTAHMIQHELITFIAPPLLLLGLPAGLPRRLFRGRLFGPALRWLTQPVVALVAFNLLFSLYHFPGIFEAGLRNEAVHFLQHLVLFVTALFLWWPLTSPLPEAPRLAEPLQLLYLFGVMVAQTVVFGLVTFAPRPFYPTYVQAPRLWGLSPLDDQQLAGAMMQIVAMAAIAPFVASAMAGWFRHEEQQAQGRPRLTSAKRVARP